MFIGALEGAALLALVGFALACAAIVRACFSARPDGTASRMALLWSGAFVAQVLGSVMARDALGGAASLGWSAAVLVAAGAAALVLGRLWRERAMEREAMQMRSRAARRPPKPPAGGGAQDAPAAADGELCGEEPANGADDLVALCARAARTYDLTRREEDVLALLAQGRTAAEVARELVVSPNTVKTHVRNVYRKLGINRRGDLAERLGL